MEQNSTKQDSTLKDFVYKLNSLSVLTMEVAKQFPGEVSSANLVALAAITKDVADQLQVTKQVNNLLPYADGDAIEKMAADTATRLDRIEVKLDMLGRTQPLRGNSMVLMLDKNTAFSLAMDLCALTSLLQGPGYEKGLHLQIAREITRQLEAAVGDSKDVRVLKRALEIAANPASTHRAGLTTLLTDLVKGAL